jgi:hypothetical protein
MRKRVPLAILLVALLCSLVLAVAVQAQMSTNYELSWHVTGSGGSGMGSTNYALAGTLGQSLVGRIESTNYTLIQGYWYPTSPVPLRIYLPIVVRSGA